MILVAGTLILCAVVVCVKLFDSDIRQSHIAKLIVDVATILSLLLIIIGLINFVGSFF